MKLGGSLLDLPDLMDRLMALAELLQPLPVLLISGGGAAADLIRSLDQRFGLTPEQSHWTAIAAMSLNAMLLARVNPEFRVVADRAAAHCVWLTGRIALLDAFEFLKSEDELLRHDSGERAMAEAGSANLARAASSVRSANNDDGAIRTRLAASWDVTSDSIAAWVAARWTASRLIVAKSCDPVSQRIGTLIATDMLDPCFSSVIGRMQIHWLNLRKSPPSLVALNDSHDPATQDLRARSGLS